MYFDINLQHFPNIQNECDVHEQIIILTLTQTTSKINIFVYHYFFQPLTIFYELGYKHMVVSIN